MKHLPRSSPYLVHDETKSFGSTPSPHPVHDETKSFGSTPSPHPVHDETKNFRSAPLPHPLDATVKAYNGNLYQINNFKVKKKYIKMLEMVFLCTLNMLNFKRLALIASEM